MERPKLQYSKILGEIAVLVSTICNGLSRGQDQPPPRVGFDPARIAPRVAPRLVTEPTERVILDTPPTPDSPPTPPSRAASRPHTTQGRGEGRAVEIVQQFLAGKQDFTEVIPGRNRIWFKTDGVGMGAKMLAMDITVSHPRLLMNREPVPFQSTVKIPQGGILRSDTAISGIISIRECGKNCIDECMFYIREGRVIEVFRSNLHANPQDFFRLMAKVYPDSPDGIGNKQRKALGLPLYRDPKLIPWEIYPR